MTGPIDLSQTSPPTTIKFLCSYGGKIFPRPLDGKLRYHGGQTRVLAVDRSISFAELLVKLVEMSGTSVNLRCQLPSEDIDALVSITSDEDLSNLFEEYDHQAASTNSSIKIRAFLSPPKSIKKVSPTPSMTDFSSKNSMKLPPKPNIRPKSAVPSRLLYPYHGPGNAGRIYYIHHGNHWQ